MPKMKYFQPVADIRNSYDDILEAFIEPDDQFSQIKLSVYDVTIDDEILLKEEVEVLHYIIACQHGLAFGSDHNIKKPTLEAVNRCFNRHLARIEDVFGINAANANKFGNPVIKKQYKACRHYLFQFSLPGWVKHLPDEILSYDNKYPKK